MFTQSQNVALAAGVKAYIRKVAESLATASVEPRFDISYEGFGLGSFPNVPADAALRYLDDLVSEQDPHFRYRTRIKGITVSVRTPDKHFG